MGKDSVVVRIDGDDSGFKHSLSGIENVAKKGLTTALKGIAAIGSGFAVATGAALKFSGDLEQNLGGSEAVFGKYADSIQKKADTAFKNMGLSTSDYLATANKMGSLFKGAGFEVEESVDLTTKAMQRAADVASIMGIDTTWAMESIAGAAKGNFTMMDNLGVAMNDTTLNAYALEIGLGKTTAQMTNQEKVALAMEMFLNRTAYAAGNYAKENETLAGALSTAKAALQNYIAGAGDIEELQESLTNASDVIVENIKVLAPKLAEGLVEIIKGLIPVIPDILIELLPSIIDTIEQLCREAVDVIPDIIAELARGIGDAIPVLSPLTGLIETLANNIDILTAAVVVGTPAVAGYNATLLAMKVVQQVSNWFATTKTVLNDYTAALVANSAMAMRGGTVNGLLLSTMTPLQMAYGVLTGKIKLADATQEKFNLTVLKNPYALAVAAVMALVSAIAYFAIKHKSATEEIEDSLKNIQEEYDSTIKSINETQTAEMAEAETTKVLKDQLFELEGQIKSGTLTQEEAEQAQREFNAVAAELEEMIPSITSLLYDETGAINVQTASVEALTQAYYNLAIAKAKVDAYKQMLETAFVRQAKAEDAYDNAVANYEEAPVREFLNAVTFGWIQSPGSALDDATEELYNANTDVTRWSEHEKAALGEVTEAEEEYNNILKELGITAGETAGSISAGNVAQTKSTKEAVDERKKLAEAEYRTIKREHENGLASDKEYYHKLAEIRNEYFDEGSGEWEEYTDEIFDYYQGVLTKTTEEANKKIDDLKEKKNDLAESLDPETYFTTYTLIDKDGERQFSLVGDNGEAAKQAEEYVSLIEQLKEKYGEIPSEVLTGLRSMSAEEGSEFIKTILKDEKRYQEALGWWQRETAAAQKAADLLYVDEENALTEEIKKVFGQIPEDFFDIGEESAKQYGEGFMGQLKNILGEVQSMISASMANLSGQLVLSGAGAGTNTSYTDARSTTINVSSATSGHAVMDAINQQQTFEEHTKKVGG